MFQVLREVKELHDEDIPEVRGHGTFCFTCPTKHLGPSSEKIVASGVGGSPFWCQE